MFKRLFSDSTRTQTIRRTHLIINRAGQLRQEARPKECELTPDIMEQQLRAFKDHMRFNTILIKIGFVALGTLVAVLDADISRRITRVEASCKDTKK